MAQTERKSLLGRVIALISSRSDEIAAGHGSLPEQETRPSARSRSRSREHQRQRSQDEATERAAEAIADAAGSLDNDIRESIERAGDVSSSDEMVRKARNRWSSD